MPGAMNRREFLQKGAWGLLTPYALVIDARGRTPGAPRRAVNAARAAAYRRTAEGIALTFPQSVTSGDPTPTGVILWTRLAPGAWDVDTDLVFEVATDAAFTQIVVQGVVPANLIGADADYTVHIDLDGQLASDHVYFYRFRYGTATSRVGRARTLPAVSQSIPQVCFGVLTCQDFLNGYYGALHHLAQDPNVDFVVHLGDFIYEGTDSLAFDTLPFPDRGILLPSGTTIARGLADYRTIYQTIRSDPWMQEAMETHTWLNIWDDHEAANDAYWDYERDTLGAPNHPFQTSAQYGNDPQLLRQLKLESQRAWSEYMPIRIAFDAQATHPHDALTIYRSFPFGDLVELFMTDERTYRSPHPCGEEGFGGRQAVFGCTQRFSPLQTMLGNAQRDWLTAGLTGSTRLWKLWANEVFLGELSIGPPGPLQFVLNLDAWDGYAAERELILDTLRAGGIKNLVALTGDLHTFMASYIKRNHTERANDNPDNTVGVEFMTPSITSSNMIEYLGWHPRSPREPFIDLRRPDAPRYWLEGLVRATNPHVRFFNSQEWGYSTVTLTREDCLYTAYSVDKTVSAGEPLRREIRRIRVLADELLMETLPLT